MLVKGRVVCTRTNGRFFQCHLKFIGHQKSYMFGIEQTYSADFLNLNVFVKLIEGAGET